MPLKYQACAIFILVCGAPLLAADPPAQPRGIERVAQYLQNSGIRERITDGVSGFRPVFGGVSPRAGFALGSEYRSPLFWDGRMLFRASARGSVREFYKTEAGLSLPKLAAGRLALDFGVARSGFPSLDYYGPGPDSSEQGRSDYLLESTSVEARATFRPAPHLSLGIFGGFIRINQGPGRDSDFVPIERIYTDREAPGLGVQPDFLSAGLSLAWDSRDEPARARRGALYFAQLSRFSDQTYGRHSFLRFDGEVQRYFQVASENNVLVLRGAASFTRAGSGQRTPFFFQPHLGGSHDLRGFRTLRFHDNNSIVTNVEFRRRVARRVDLAAFTDVGKVFPSWNRLAAGGVEAAFGGGLRYYIAKEFVVRVDTAYSREGPRVWLSLSHAF